MQVSCRAQLTGSLAIIEDDAISLQTERIILFPLSTDRLQLKEKVLIIQAVIN